MTVIVTAAAAAAGNRFLLTAALTYRLVRPGDAARPAPDGIGPTRRAAIDCRRPL